MIRKIKSIIPKKIRENQDLQNFFMTMFVFIRTQKLVTALAGPSCEVSRNLIEIDITYVCNLNCFNCNRSCGLAPSSDRVNLGQIKKFIRESTAQGRQWERIRLLGGEPTLHPEFLLILDELLAFKKSHCPGLTIEVATNGFGKKVNAVLSRVHSGVVVINSSKESRKQKFVPFNLAPQDYAIYRNSDFSCGCGVMSNGMGLTPYGYYPCALSGAIDRVWGFDIGRKSLPSLSDSMRDQMEILCRSCGHFMTYMTRMNDKNLVSDSWRKAYERYKISKPQLTFY